jgi:opacity protein-like surface antigen
MAAENPFFGVTWGKTSANYGGSSRAAELMPQADFDDVIHRHDTWSVRGGEVLDSGRYYLNYNYVSTGDNGIDLRQQMLSASYDHFLPITDAFRAFAGVSAGATYVNQVASGYSSDRDWGAHAGVQAGVIALVSDNVEVELGYRYAKHDGVSVDFHDKALGARTGSARLNSTEQAYLGLNWRF